MQGVLYLYRTDYNGRFIQHLTPGQAEFQTAGRPGWRSRVFHIAGNCHSRPKRKLVNEDPITGK